MTFAMVPDATWPGSDQWPWGTAPAPGPVGQLGCPGVSNPWGVGSFLSLVRPRCAPCPGLLAPVHRCARAVCCVVSAVSLATWLLFTGVPARCGALRMRCPGPLGSRSPVCPLSVLCCVCGVLGHLSLVRGAPAPCFALCARCPGSLGCCLPVCLLGLLFCLCGVLGLLAPVHRCARAVCCVVSAVFWATWLLFTGVSARCVVLRVWRPGPLGSRSPVCPLGVLCWVCGVLGQLVPVHRCARSVCCFACAVSRASWLLFTDVPGRGVSSLCCPRCTHVCGVLALVAPVHRCARCVRCVCAIGGCVPSPPPLIFVFFCWKKKKNRGARTLQAHARTAGAVVQ